jgi:hypothetical protein
MIVLDPKPMPLVLIDLLNGIVAAPLVPVSADAMTSNAIAFAGA